jgi:trehalose 6-phosphate synthase
MIIVSHRGPFGFSVDASGALHAVRGPGGLAGTLHHLAASGALEDTTCVSAALTDGDHRVARGEPHPDVGTELCLVELETDTHRLHYEVVSNEVLWFLFHGIFDLPRSPTFGHAFRDAWTAYVAVNRAFADRVADLAPAGDVVLVQDYPLGLVPGMLAHDRPDLRLCYFAHTPFSGPGGMRMLPDHVAFELSASLARRPCGFHTRRWADAYEGSTRMVLGPDADIAPTFAASLGPDPAGLAEIAASSAVQAAHDELDELVGDCALLYRSDRIDLTKNIARGFQAYDEMLEAYPQWRERVVFVARLNPSRASVPEYAAYSEETERVAERVNDRWATSSWTPLVVDTRDDYERTVAGFLRYDVLLVNPIKDGLNLVAKEGPLVNARDGVLCLSPEAGAYEELSDAALRVHPYDLDQTAATMHRALSMPADERATRAARLRSAAAARTPEQWLRDLVTHAR